MGFESHSKYEPGRYGADRHLYYSDQRINLQKLKEEAYAIARGNSRATPAKATVHQHKYLEPCNDKCESFFPEDWEDEQEGTKK